MNVRHYVCGSLASSLHGEPRATNDADLVAELSLHHFERFRTELGDRFYLDEESFREAVTRERSFNLVDEVELAKVDVFCVKAAGFQGEALRRSVELELMPDDPFSRVHVASAADTVVFKLHWYRLAGEVSDRQWRDIQGVLLAQKDRLDLEYMRVWCRHFAVEDLLDRALEASRSR